MMMSSASFSKNLPGKWTGKNQLWLPPNENTYESNTEAKVAVIAQGKFTTFAYSWAFEQKPQDGLIVFRHEPNMETSKSFWLDSWHMQNDIMLCESTWDDKGLLIIKGSYPAPPDPDWGWRIEIENPEIDFLVMRMINISPQGEEALAVLA